MKTFDELEALLERYNYKEMTAGELHELVDLLLTDRSAFEHFYQYKVARDLMR